MLSRFRAAVTSVWMAAVKWWVTPSPYDMRVPSDFRSTSARAEACSYVIPRAPWVMGHMSTYPG